MLVRANGGRARLVKSAVGKEEAMARPYSRLQGRLRRSMPLRSVLSWFLLAFLVVGAASYVQGTRYALATGQVKHAVLDYLTAPDTSLPGEAGVKADRMLAHLPKDLKREQ
jgi:hypothetical protein